MSEQEHEQERLAAELAEELRNLRVEDVLVNTLLTISSIGYRRLGLTADTREDRDLEQTRLAIETMRALAPVLEQVVPSELVADFSSSVANLQLAYAKAAREESHGRGQTPGVAEEDAPPPADPAGSADAAD